MAEHRSEDRTVNFRVELEPDGLGSSSSNAYDREGVMPATGKSKIEIFREAFIEKAIKFQHLLKLRATATQSLPKSQEQLQRPKQRAIALQPNRRSSTTGLSKTFKEATADEIVTQRHSDRVVRERIQAVPDHMKALVSKAELDILQDLFESSDLDGSGLIGMEELPDMLRVLGLNPLEFTVKELLKEFDKSSDGELNFGEFVCLWYSYSEERGKENDTLETAFAFFDKDDSDSIDKEEFVAAMSELGDPPLTQEEISLFFSLIDTDNSGVITKQVFLKFCGQEASMALSTFNSIQQTFSKRR